MNDIKFYIGPMSKNVVDSVIEFVEETGNKIGFIPSRRQVEYDGGSAAGAGDLVLQFCQ